MRALHTHAHSHTRAVVCVCVQNASINLIENAAAAAANGDCEVHSRLNGNDPATVCRGAAAAQWRSDLFAEAPCGLCAEHWLRRRGPPLWAFRVRARLVVV